MLILILFFCDKILKINIILKENKIKLYIGNNKNTCSKRF